MMAVSRYIAVCHPLHARSFINQRGTRIIIFAVWLGSLAVNLPRFWRYRPMTVPCRLLGLPVTVQSGCHCVYYHRIRGQLFRVSGFASAYNAVWATVAIFVPLLAMIVCNWCLVQALRRSSAMQRRCCRPSVTNCRAGPFSDTAVRFGSVYNRNDTRFDSPAATRGTTSSAGHRITPTMVALVVLFLALVGPSEILTFVKDYFMTNITKQVIPNYFLHSARYSAATTCRPTSYLVAQSRRRCHVINAERCRIGAKLTRVEVRVGRGSGRVAL